MKSIKKMRPFAAAWPAMLLLVAACGGSTSATSTPAVTALPTQQPATSTPAPSPTPAARSAELTALYVKTDGAVNIGGTSKVKVTISPNDNKDLRVGFFENEVGGSGPMWRAAGWMAATISTLLTGSDPTKNQISYDVGGRIDGPSAGALMTIGTLAVMRGDKVRDDAAMTGTINPDGTIGAVGGIPHKIDGAAKAGKKLVLIPSGQRQSQDYNTKSMVDVVELGKQLNVEVIEVPDIFTAYKILTGKTLPKIEAGATRPEVQGQIYDKAKAKTGEWLSRAEEAQAQYKSLADTVKIEALENFMNTSADKYKRAKQLVNQGLIGGAYNQALQSGLYASVGAQVGRTLETYLKKGMPGAVLEMQAMSASTTKVQALADSLKAERPKTLSDATAMLTAYGNLIEVISYNNFADDLLANAQEQIKSGKIKGDDALEAVFKAAVYYRIAGLGVEAAKDVKEVGLGMPGAALPTDAAITTSGEFFRRAAEANLNLLETQFIDSEAKAANVRADVLRNFLAEKDNDYLLALSDQRVLGQLEKYFGQGEPLQWAKLAGAINAYNRATSLVSKYLVLDAQLDDNMNVTGIQNEKALINALDLAEEQARAGIADMKANNVDPGLFAISYETGRVNRNGNASEKLEALGDYWNVYTFSRAIAYLGRFSKVDK